MDWVAFVDKLGLAIAGVLAAYGAITARRAKQTGRRAAGAAGAQRAEQDSADAEVSSEISRMWSAVADVRARVKRLETETGVGPGDRKSAPPREPRERRAR